MTPSLSVATDNIYKFACLFGLALIISAIYAYVTVYTSSLDRQVKYAETVILLEAKTERSKSDNDLLALTTKLIEVTKANKEVAINFSLTVFVGGLVLSVLGALAWNRKIQQRDDRLAFLQLEKLELEVAKLRKVAIPLKPEAPPVAEEAASDG